MNQRTQRIINALKPLVRKKDAWQAVEITHELEAIPLYEIEQNLTRATAVLDVVQTLFTQELDAPPNNDIIFHALESVQKELEEIRKAANLA